MINNNIDNSKLIGLLENYGKDHNPETYKAALDEIIEGSSHLILPSVNDGQAKDQWKTLEKDSKLKLTSVFDQDGIKVLVVFSELPKLMEWSKKMTGYTAMDSKDVIEFCQAQGIDRIVIDTGSPTMFVLERNKGNTQAKTTQEETKVRIGTPTHPIKEELLIKFQESFKNVSVIQEVYQYAMIRNDETVLVLGFVLDTYNQNATTACVNAIQDSMQGETLEMPLEMFMLNNEEWYRTVKEIDNSVVYCR